jgi:hypothetical protein
MRSRISAAAVLFLLVLSTACDQRAPTDPAARTPDPLAAILDGSSGGNAHFFFLPPVVKKATFTGVFNGSVAPTVEICTSTQQNAQGHCTSLLARYKRFPVAGDEVEPITVSLKGEKYTVNWNTKLKPGPLNVPFRMVVLLGDIQLGYVDLIRTANNSVKNTTTGTTLNRNIDGTVPIDFRIENGVLCATTSTECFEGSVGPNGGTFTITRNDGTKPAGTQFPAGALDETVTLIIERYFGECLPTDVPQYQGCYKFRTEPHIENFELPATVGVCLFDPAALPFFNSGQLRLWKWSEETGDPILELERVTIDYLECPPITQIGMRTNNSLLLGAARAGAMLFRPLASLIMPREAYALAPYEGGKLINFSRIGWVRPLSVEITGGNGQTGTAGKPLTTPLSMRVINKYGSVIQPLPGRTLNFTPSGNGSANLPATITDGAGSASTIWTLSTTPGANTLLARTPTSRAIAPTPYEAEAIFTATGQPPLTVFWMPTLGGTFEFTGTPVTGLTPTVLISVDGQPLQTLTTNEVVDGYQASWDLTQLTAGPIYRLTVRLGGDDLGYIDLRVVDGRLRTVEGDRTVLTLDQVSIYRFKFKLLQ